MRNTVLVRRFVADESGATAVEYGIMVALIAAVIIGTVAILGGKVRDELFYTVTDGFPG